MMRRPTRRAAAISITILRATKYGDESMNFLRAVTLSVCSQIVRPSEGARVGFFAENAMSELAWGTALSSTPAR
jgi:hypothetical protein